MPSVEKIGYIIIFGIVGCGIPLKITYSKSTKDVPWGKISICKLVVESLGF